MSTIKSDTENLIFDAVGASSEIRLYLDGTQTVTLDSSGNFGIGTSSPSAVLDVNGTAKVTALNINGTALSASATELSLLNGITGIADEDNMVSDSATQLATQQSIKAYVDTSITNLIGGAPGALDTLNELAAAINDDANVYSTLTTSIASKLSDITGESIESLSDVNSMTPTDGQLLTWDNANSRWDAADAPVSLPSQTGNSGYYLTTDGSSASWAALSTTFPFYDSSGSADNISVTNGQFPFYNSSGTQDNIGVS